MPYNWNGGGAYMQDNNAVFGQVQVPQNMVGGAPRPQTVRPSYIPGKMVNSPQDIVPQEVPMDGSAAVFPSSDLSCIYLKAWGSDGLIKTFRYVPEVPEEAKKSPEATFQETILERLNSIEELVKKPRYQKPYCKKPNQNGSKKEDTSNESE